MRTLLASIVLSFLPASTMCAAAPNHDAIMHSACGSSQQKFNAHKRDQHTVLEPKDGKAVIYVISKMDYAGIPVGCQVVTRIGLDGKWIGANCGTSYLSTTVTPGDHHLCSDWQSAVLFHSRPQPSLQRFTAEAGKTYYFRAHVVYAQGIVSINLEPINVDEGKMLIASSPISISSPKR